MLGLRERDDYKTQIVFVRHGESCGNAGLAAPADFHPDDPPLTEKGLWQALRLSGCFYVGEIDRIYASPLTRAIQTAYPTAELLGMRIELLPELMERDTHTAGCEPEKLGSIFPLCLPFEPMLLPEKESDEMLAQRARRCIDRITDSYHGGETVLVVTHGTFMSYLVRASLCAGCGGTFNVEADNCSVSCVAIRKDGMTPLLRTVNYTSHLN